jgi:hypothetical protein
MLIPKCIYCKRSLGYTYPDGLRHAARFLDEAGQPKRGRMGLGLFCSLRCIEEDTRKRYTGKSKPRGKSHGGDA